MKKLLKAIELSNEEKEGFFESPMNLETGKKNIF